MRRRCSITDAEHRLVAERLDRELRPGSVDSTSYLALDWLLYHAPADVKERWLRWCHRVAPKAGDVFPPRRRRAKRGS